MGDQYETREIRRLLSESGAKLLRTTGRGSEVWELPNGAKFFATLHTGDYRALKNNLAELRRALGPEPTKAPPAAPKKEPEPMTVIPMKQPPPPQPLPEPEKPARGESWKTRWTSAQDKIVIEGYAASMTPEEIAILLQDLRPGVTGEWVIARASNLRRKFKALGIGQTKPIAVPQPPVAVEPAAAFPLVKRDEIVVRQALARVTIEIGGKVRSFEVDETTARKMLAEAMSL